MQVPTEEEGGKAVKEEGAGGDEEGKGEAGAAKEEGVAKEKEDGIDDDAAKGSGEGGGENEKEHDACAKWKEQGTSVAVKIQKVPVDEVRFEFMLWGAGGGGARCQSLP